MFPFTLICQLLLLSMKEGYISDRFLHSTIYLLTYNSYSPFLSNSFYIGKVSNNRIFHYLGIELGIRQFRMAKNLLHGRDWNALVA